MALERTGGLDGVGNKKWSLMRPHFIYPEEKTGTTHPSLEGLPTSPAVGETIPICSLISSSPNPPYLTHSEHIEH